MFTSLLRGLRGRDSKQRSSRLQPSPSPGAYDELEASTRRRLIPRDASTADEDDYGGEDEDGDEDDADEDDPRLPIFSAAHLGTPQPVPCSSLC